MAKERKIKPRNPVARSPLLRKGGVHEKSRSSERSDTKRDLEEKVANLDDESEAEDESDADPGNDSGTDTG